MTAGVHASPLEVRVAVDADLDPLVALEQVCFPAAEAWSSQSWRDELAGSDRTVLVAVADHQVVGAITVSRQFETVDLVRVMVAPSCRRQRIGERLVHEAAWYVRDAQKVLLEVRHDNAAALMLYARLGFRAIDRRADYYGTGRHAVVMQAELPLPDRGEQT